MTTTNLTRRIIRNDSPAPVSYGLRRVLRRVKVKVQDLGPRLVWQLYVRTPGKGLARSKFVHFREAGPIAIPEVPPGLPPRPVGGTDTGTTSSSLKFDPGRGYYVTVVIQPGADRVVTRQYRFDHRPRRRRQGRSCAIAAQRRAMGRRLEPRHRHVHQEYRDPRRDGASVSINYTYGWDPAGPVMAAWEAQRQAAVAALNEEALNKKFDREKALITERSKIRPRPAADLRKEERYEVMNRMVSHLFANKGNGQDPSPLEIEYFHRYFDIDGMFTYTHPSWWKPRYTPVATGLGRRPMRSPPNPNRPRSAVRWAG